MSKKTASDSVADQIASFIGKSMGRLVNKKESLQAELADVEKQIDGVRRKVMKQFGGADAVAKQARSTVKRAGKTLRRELSPETRRKMAIAAKKRWARARKAAKDATGV
jgi:hypothetical protein